MGPAGSHEAKTYRAASEVGHDKTAPLCMMTGQYATCLRKWRQKVCQGAGGRRIRGVNGGPYLWVELQWLGKEAGIGFWKWSLLWVDRVPNFVEFPTLSVFKCT